MAEACGNTFLVLFADSERDREVYLYLDNLRLHRRWHFDTALALLLVPSGVVRMHVLEKDGTESNMCGNGLRVAGCVLDQLGLPRLVAVRSGLIPIDRIHPGVFEAPVLVKQLGIRFLSRDEPVFILYSVSGELHAVAVVSDVYCAPLNRWALKFVPFANCTVVSRAGQGKLYARTCERGGVGITASCGTGACAAAHAVHNLLDDSSRFAVSMHENTLHVTIGSHHTYLGGQAAICKIT